MASLVPRIAFFPSLVYNVVLNKLSIRQWYNQIDDAVIIGALPFKSMTRELVNKNVKGVVSLTESHELRYLANTKAEWAAAGVAQIHFKILDFVGTPSQEDIDKGVKFITDIHKNTGGVTYVHCKAGRTRSCTMVACYLMKTRGMTPDEAFAEIRSKRPHVLLRRQQWESLRSYHRTLKNS